MGSTTSAKISPVGFDRKHRGDKLRVKLEKLLGSLKFNALLGIFLFIVLFSIDILTLTDASSRVDQVVYILLVISIFLFSAEVLMRMYVEGKKYVYTIFFTLDLVGNVAILFDLPWFQDLLFGGNATEIASAELLRTSRASKIGSKAGQLLRLLRLMRIIRVAKIMRFLSTVGVSNPRNRRDSTDFVIYNPDNVNKDGRMETSSLRIGETLNLAIAQRVAILVLFSVLVPTFLFDSSDPHLAKEFGVLQMETFAASEEECTSETANNYAMTFFQYFKDIDEEPLNLTLQSGSKTREWDWSLTYNKSLPIRRSSYLTIRTLNATGVFNIEQAQKKNARANIMLILFVVALLLYFSGTLSSSCNKLVVEPLNRILKSIYKNTAELANQLNQAEGGSMETDMLESMIDKLGKIVVAKQNNPISRIDSFMGDQTLNESTKGFLAANFTRYSEVAGKRVRRGSDIFSTVGQSFKSTFSRRLSVEAASAESMLELDSWNYDVLSYEEATIKAHCVEVIRRIYVKNVGIIFEPQVVERFVTSVRSKYINTNPYHNFNHGVDVMHTCYRFLTLTKATDFLSHEEQLAVVVAALGHDIGHVGFNNNFLIETSHELALTYNDKSVLENYHCKLLFDILSEDGVNLLAQFSKDQYKAMRNVIIDAVLATDMNQHFDMVSEAQVCAQLIPSWESASIESRISVLADQKYRFEVIKLFLHAADLNNPSKPRTISIKWTERVMEEFFLQGDEEASRGLTVSGMFDRRKTDIAETQVNFIAFIVWPLYKQLVIMFPQLRSCGERVITNQEEWFRDFSSRSTNDENLKRMSQQLQDAKADLSLVPIL